MDYPPFDGTQACHDPAPPAARAFNAAPGADPAPALALCGACRWTAACRGWALVHEAHGVWGGTTDADRAAIRRREGLPDPAPAGDLRDALILAARRAQLQRDRVRRAS